ncbi:MAG: hypothetical protein P1Q69_11530 [Candidatus Thorarchaeota archaeon]|nr:hypothetical protein [Candidatus Thorarchaeota archaeon]
MQEKDNSRSKYPLGAILIVIIIISSAGLVSIAFPAEENIFSFEDDTMEPSPVYYRFSLQTAEPVLVHLRFNLISRDSEDSFIEFAYGLYECNLQTFDGNFQIGDNDAMWEFRREHEGRSGGVCVESYDDILWGEDTIQGSYVFGWWLSARIENPNWSFSISISLRPAS